MERLVKQQNRIIYIDILRIISIVAVILLHTTADLLIRSNDFNTMSWWVSNILNSIARFAVPVFFMISGAMILKIEITSYRDFYIKRIGPLLIPLLSWSLIYDIYNQYYILKSNLGFYEFIIDFGYRLVMDKNYVHLWFLYAIIAIYMTVPLISKLVKVCSEKDIRYYVIAWFIISVMYPLLLETVVRVTNQNIYIPIMNIPMFMGFLGYFILGYYLFNYELSPRLKNIFFNLGIISFFLTPVATYFVSMHSGVLDEMFYGNYSITTLFMSISIFIYFKEKDTSISTKVNPKVKLMISSISKASFSIYLIHLLVELLIYRKLEIEDSLLLTSINQIFNAIAIFLISYITVKVLMLNKYVTKLLFGGRG